MSSAKLNNVHCVHARAEDYAKEHRESFDIVSARAVANLTMLSELCIPLVKVGGMFLALKGANAQESMRWLKKQFAFLGVRRNAGMKKCCRMVQKGQFCL